VETVGATLTGLNPLKMPVIQEFVKRGLGEGSLENIEVVGASLESLREKFSSAAKAQKKLRARGSGPQTWGGQANRAFRGLIREGFFKQPDGRTMEDVVEALKARGLSAEDKQSKIGSFLTRRVKKGILKKSRNSNGIACWTE